MKRKQVVVQSDLINELMYVLEPFLTRRETCLLTHSCKVIHNKWKGKFDFCCSWKDVLNGLTVQIPIIARRFGSTIYKNNEVLTLEFETDRKRHIRLHMAHFIVRVCGILQSLGWMEIGEWTLSKEPFKKGNAAEMLERWLLEKLSDIFNACKIKLDREITRHLQRV
jgi:hypothetical protein